jgi:hypothetical protein
MYCDYSPETVNKMTDFERAVLEDARKLYSKTFYDEACIEEYWESYIKDMEQ